MVLREPTEKYNDEIKNLFYRELKKTLLQKSCEIFFDTKLFSKSSKIKTTIVGETLKHYRLYGIIHLALKTNKENGVTSNIIWSVSHENKFSRNTWHNAFIQDDL